MTTSITVSQMDGDHFVPISVLANFNQVLLSLYYFVIKFV
jgi:hypothetical protein